MSVAPGTFSRWSDDTLVLGNARFSETWRADSEGRLKLVAFARAGGAPWVRASSAAVPPPASSAPPEWSAEFSTRVARHHRCAQPSLIAELRFIDPAAPAVWRLHRFRVFADLPGAVHEILGPAQDAALARAPEDAAAFTPQADGIETADNGRVTNAVPAGASPAFTLARPHCRVREVAFTDQTDYHATFAATREWSLHPSERCLPLRANLVHVEDPASADAEGFLLLLLAPLRHVRAGWSPTFDFVFALGESGGFDVSVCPGGYALARIAYAGGALGAALALQALQAALHEWMPGRDGLVLSNTWGDRSGAARLSEAFILAEIDAARALGVEIVQIDDGWQKGDTVNTVPDRSRGVWTGFWAADPEFWAVHPRRFPRGLAPLVAAAREAGLRLGLWFAPDSTHDFANWEKDAAQLLRLWREHGVADFKLDAVKLRSRLGETRLHALCDRVQDESGGEIRFDFDATAERRPAYWGRVHGGPLFLENRYTDRASYHPHQTLDALWTLAAAGVSPRRIRLEFLNPERNDDAYPAGDSLRPVAYPAATLLAITLPASPLAWCELSRLPSEIAAAWRDLLAAWRPHRETFQAGRVLPVGERPDGHRCTGFVSWNPAEGVLHALLFRELAPAAEAALALPDALGLPADAAWGPAERIAGSGAVKLDPATRSLRVGISDRQHFVLARFRRASRP